MRYGINIVNISAGTAKEKQFDESSPLVRKVEELWDAGLVVVVSAGNRGPEAGTDQCSRKTAAKSLPSVIMAEKEIPAPACTIHCIKKPDVITPGSHIVSCHHTNIEKVPYTKKSGTSMATPVVSGGIALLLSLPKYRFYEPKEVKIRLKNSCTDLASAPQQTRLGTFRSETVLVLNTPYSDGRCQISSLYCAIVRSEEKNPAFAIFTSIFFAHAVRSL